jgi:hypothetical protein
MENLKIALEMIGQGNWMCVIEGYYAVPLAAKNGEDWVFRPGIRCRGRQSSSASRPFPWG